jgi:hybrid cluster-associated redox disulfide protein
MLVADVVAGTPAAARVFLDRRMGCVGCAFAPFETVAEAARAYGIEPWELATSLAVTVSTCEEVRQ